MCSLTDRLWLWRTLFLVFWLVCVQRCNGYEYLIPLMVDFCDKISPGPPNLCIQLYKRLVLLWWVGRWMKHSGLTFNVTNFILNIWYFQQDTVYMNLFQAKHCATAKSWLFWLWIWEWSFDLKSCCIYTKISISISYK